MGVRKLLTIFFALALAAIVIIGLIDFDLMIEIWVKIFIGVLFAGVMIGAVKSLFGDK